MLDPQDKEWFEAQVRREHVSLRCYVRSLGVRSDVVDDIAQDARIVAMKKLDSFDRARNFGSWVRGIAKKLLLNHRRTESRREFLLSEHLTDIRASLGTECPIGEEDGKLGQLEALRTCMADLPEKSRQLMYSRYYQEESPGFIASRLSQSSEQVGVTLFRIRKKLLSCVRSRLALGGVE